MNFDLRLSNAVNYVKEQRTSTCDVCDELEDEEDFTCFTFGRKQMFLCPKCTDKRSEENPRSEVL